MFAVMLLAAQLAAAPAPPRVSPGTYTYETSYQGANLGKSTITVTGDGTQFSEHVTGAYSGTSADANATLVLDTDLAPISYKASGTMGGNAMSDSASVNGGVASVTNARGVAASFTLGKQASHFVFVDLGSLAGFVALPEQMHAWNDASVLAVIPSFGQAIALTPQAAEPASSATNVPANDVSLHFGGHVPFTIWYDPATLVPDVIDIPTQNLLVTRVSS